MVESFQKRDRDRRNALKRRDKEAKRREKSRVKRGDGDAPLASSRPDYSNAPDLNAPFQSAPVAQAPVQRAPVRAPAPPPPAPAPAPKPASVLAPWLRSAPAPLPNTAANSLPTNPPPTNTFSDGKPTDGAPRS